MPIIRLERMTYWLQISCSTNWAKSAKGGQAPNEKDFVFNSFLGFLLSAGSGVWKRHTMQKFTLGSDPSKIVYVEWDYASYPTRTDFQGLQIPHFNQLN